MNLNEFFSKTFNIPCSEYTKAYISKTFSKPIIISESITIVYSEAKSKYSFEKFQNVGDWLLFAKSVFPQHLSGASPEYYDAIAQNSYYRCYRIAGLEMYEELADRFPTIVEHIAISFPKQEI